MRDNPKKIYLSCTDVRKSNPAVDRAAIISKKAQCFCLGPPNGHPAADGIG
jgi:hypothetical protein